MSGSYLFPSSRVLLQLTCQTHDLVCGFTRLLRCLYIAKAQLAGRVHVDQHCCPSRTSPPRIRRASGVSISAEWPASAAARHSSDRSRSAPATPRAAIRQFDLDMPFRQTLPQARQLDLNDLLQVFFRKRVEHDESRPRGSGTQAGNACATPPAPLPSCGCSSRPRNDPL